MSCIYIETYVVYDSGKEGEVIYCGLLVAVRVTGELHADPAVKR